MWSLIFESTGKKLSLIVNKVYTIGRKDTDIVIADDSSISRKHGSIKITPSGNSFLVTLSDNSKFGSFYCRNVQNANKEDNFIKVDGSTLLADGDILRIGVQHTKLKLILEKFWIITSMMDHLTKDKLTLTLSKIGGMVIDSWKNEVTHLVMNKIVLNVKVAQALANACYIVSVCFFENLLEAILKKKEHPKEQNFLPPISEEGLDVDIKLFLPNNSRKSLFKDQMFVFFSNKQLKRLGFTCKAAGASVKLISDFSKDELLQCVKNSCETRFLGGNSPDFSLISKSLFSQLESELLSKDLRFILEHEIALALLYCSIDVYTNPEFNLTMDNTFTQHSVQEASSSEVRASQGFAETVKCESLDDAMMPFLSSVPETVNIRNDLDMVEDSSSKKRSYSAAMQSNDNFSSIKAPEKLIKLDKSLANEDTKLFENKESECLKPLLKRKLTSNDGLLDMQTTKQTHSDISKENSSFEKVVESIDIVKKEVPDSYFYGDNLWTNKADSQKMHDDLPSSYFKTKTLKTEIVNDKTQNNLFSESQIPDSNKKNFILKKAFVPASVPEDDGSNILPNFDPDLPFNNLSIVRHVSLVKSKPLPHLHLNSSAKTFAKSKNFKKFVKVHPAYRNYGSQTNLKCSKPPRIIGGRDLIKHVNRIDKAADYPELF